MNEIVDSKKRIIEIKTASMEHCLKKMERLDGRSKNYSLLQEEANSLRCEIEELRKGDCDE